MKIWQKWMTIFAILILCISVGVSTFSAMEVIEYKEKSSKAESDMEKLLEKEQEIKEKEDVLKEVKQLKEVNETKEKQTENTGDPENLIIDLEMSEIETEEQNLNGHVVGIDPGHQGSWVDMSEQEPNGPGSITYKTKCTVGTTGRFTGVPEYELNLDISLALRDELVSRGYQVIMTREDHDTAISNAERAQKVAAEGGEIYVRIHANGSDDSSVSGALGMTPSPQNPYVAHLYEDSYRLTECILNDYCTSTGFGNLGIQYYDNMTGINWSSVPVTILEMGFMTNEGDDYAMQDPSMQEKMVQGIANGIDRYFEVEN